MESFPTDTAAIHVATEIPAAHSAMLQFGVARRTFTGTSASRSTPAIAALALFTSARELADQGAPAPRPPSRLDHPGRGPSASGRARRSGRRRQRLDRRARHLSTRLNALSPALTCGDEVSHESKRSRGIRPRSRRKPETSRTPSQGWDVSRTIPARGSSARRSTPASSSPPAIAALALFTSELDQVDAGDLHAPARPLERPGAQHRQRACRRSARRRRSAALLRSRPTREVARSWKVPSSCVTDSPAMRVQGQGGPVDEHAFGGGTTLASAGALLRSTRSTSRSARRARRATTEEVIVKLALAVLPGLLAGCAVSTSIPRSFSLPTNGDDKITVPNVFDLQDQALAALRGAGYRGEVSDASGTCGSVVDDRVIEVGHVCDLVPRSP